MFSRTVNAKIEKKRKYAYITLYTAVAQDRPFGSRFLEMALISIGVAVISFGVGIAAKHFLGVDV